MSEAFNPRELKESISAVGVAFEEFKKTNDARLVELDKKGAVDPLTEEKLAKINEAIDLSQKRLDDFELAQKRKARVVTDADGNEVDMEAKATKWITGIHGNKAPAFDAAKMEGYKAAVNSYMRKGDLLMDDAERKALSVGTDSDGGYFVHPDTSGQVVTKVFETSPMRAYASAQTISTSSLEGMFDLDEAAAGWVGETAARPDTGTPQLGKWAIPVHEIYASPKATQKLLDDAEISVEAWLAGKVADQFARKESEAFVTGNGIAKPRGFLDYADGTTLPGTIEQIKTGANGAFVAAPNGGDVLIDAVYALKAAYRANANWFMNRMATKEVRKLKDTDGAYLWQNGIALGQPATLAGYGVASFEDMPDIATGSLSMAFGDMRQAYQIVDHSGIRVLRDPFTAKPYIVFYSTKRVGGDVVNFEAVKLINFAA